MWGCRVQHFLFRVWGVGFRVEGEGLSVLGVGCRVLATRELRTPVHNFGLGFTVPFL